MNVTRKEMKKLIDTLRFYTVTRQDCFTVATLLEKHFLGPEYHHKKRGTNYTVVGMARLQFNDPIEELRKWVDTKREEPDHGEITRIVLDAVSDKIEAIAIHPATIKDSDMLVLYRGDDGVYSVRHPVEFHDGRFVHITEKNQHEYDGSN